MRNRKIGEELPKAECEGAGDAEIDQCGIVDEPLGQAREAASRRSGSADTGRFG
jgi:hypothetical protein